MMWNKVYKLAATDVGERLDAVFHLLLLRALQPRAVRHAVRALQQLDEHRLSRLKAERHDDS